MPLPSFPRSIPTARRLQFVFSSLFPDRKSQSRTALASTDGCFLIAGVYKGKLGYGSYQLAAKGEHNAFIVKLDRNLGLIWSKTFSCSGTLHDLRITEFSGGDILLGGGVFGEPFHGSRNLFFRCRKGSFCRPHESFQRGDFLDEKIRRSRDDSISALKSQGSLIYLAGGVKKTETKAYSFLFELDHNGIALKSSSFKGPNENQIVDLDVGGGRIYLLGSFDTSIELAGKTLNSSGSSAFVLCMKTGLTEEWASVLASQGEPLGVETDAFGFPIFLARFKDSSMIGDSALSLISAGQGDLFFAKLNKDDGSFLWSKQLGGVGDETSSDLKTDPYGKVLALVNTDQSFAVDGLASGEGSLFLASIESRQKPSFAEDVDLSLTKGVSFYREINATAPLGFAQMQLIGGPSWVYLKDDRNGTGIIGGVVPPEAEASTDFLVRAFDADGGYADLNVSCSISDNNRSAGTPDQFPGFSGSIELGSNVILSDVGVCGSGNYLVCGKFTDTLSVGSFGAVSTSGYDGFALKVDSQGKAEDLLHLASDGGVTPVASVKDDDGTIHLTGYYAGKLSVGYMEIESAGQSRRLRCELEQGGEFAQLAKLRRWWRRKTYLRGISRWSPRCRRVFQ